MIAAWRRRRQLARSEPGVGRPFGIDVPREQLVDEARQLDEELDQLEDALEGIRTIVDREARILGHAHPVIVDVRAILDRVAP